MCRAWKNHAGFTLMSTELKRSMGLLLPDQWIRFVVIVSVLGSLNGIALVSARGVSRELAFLFVKGVPSWSKATMYYFAAFWGRFLLTAGILFAYSSYCKAAPCQSAGHRWVHSERRFFESVRLDRERHRRGNPERPAPLWTVTYRLGSSFRGL
jgi:hypothetical protein